MIMKSPLKPIFKYVFTLVLHQLVEAKNRKHEETTAGNNSSGMSGVSEEPVRDKMGIARDNFRDFRCVA